MNIHIYVLKLKSGRLYVGQSTDPRRRFFEHQAGKGANICKMDHPQEILWQGDTGSADHKVACALENFIAIQCMDKFTPTMVAGGHYCDESYRTVSDGWIVEETSRIMGWIDRMNRNGNLVFMRNIIISFNTWRDQLAEKLEQYVEM